MTTAAHETLTSPDEQAGLDILKLLTKHGANITDARNQKGRTVLQDAAAQGKTAFIEALVIEHGVDINPESPPPSPLELAAVGGHMAAIRKLLELGADRDIRKGYSIAIESRTFAECQARMAQQPPPLKEYYMNELAWDSGQRPYRKLEARIASAEAGSNGPENKDEPSLRGGRLAQAVSAAARRLSRSIGL